MPSRAACVVSARLVFILVGMLERQIPLSYLYSILYYQNYDNNAVMHIVCYGIAYELFSKAKSRS